METMRYSPIAVLAVVGLIAPGCGSSSRVGPPNGGVDGGDCYPLPSPARPYANIASGTVTGDRVNGTVCKVPIYLLSSSSPNVSLPENELLLVFGLDSNQSLGAQIDAGRADGWVEGAMQLPAPIPGTYASGDGMCGFVMFGYDGSPAPNANCTGTPPACSPDCVPVAPSFDSGAYCGPQWPHDVYEATGESTCLDPTPVTPTGSWTLNLETVQPADVDAGAGVTAYLVHGRLAAVLPDGAGSVATLALAF
jgi:hypothetical protein